MHQELGQQLVVVGFMLHLQQTQQLVVVVVVSQMQDIQP
jgi:hypothetical protein